MAKASSDNPSVGLSSVEKRKQTLALQKLREAKEQEEREKETAAGRKSKNDALKTAVWKPKRSRSDSAATLASAHQPLPKKPKQHSHSRANEAKEKARAHSKGRAIDIPLGNSETEDEDIRQPKKSLRKAQPVIEDSEPSEEEEDDHDDGASPGSQGDPHESDDDNDADVLGQDLLDNRAKWQDDSEDEGFRGQRRLSRAPSSVSSFHGDIDTSTFSEPDYTQLPPEVLRDDNTEPTVTEPTKDTEERRLAPQVRRERPVKSSKRAQTTVSEKPQWKLNEKEFQCSENTAKVQPQKPMAKAKLSPESEQNWPAETRIVFPAPGQNLSIMHQTANVRKVIQAGIFQILLDAHFVNAFPEPQVVAQTTYALLPKLAKTLKERAIYERMKKEAAYVYVLAKPVTGRMNNFRSEVKTENIASVESHYNLHLGIDSSVIETTVTSLLNMYTFHYGLDASGKPARTKPFCNDAVKLVLRKSFGKPVINKKYGKYFVSSFPDDPARKDEPELPRPMVALAVAAIRSIICDWQGGQYHRSAFEQNTNLSAYNQAIKDLELIGKNNPRAYHRLMADLYIDTFASTRRFSIETNSDAISANIDFGGMEE